MTGKAPPRSLSEIRFYVTRAMVGAGLPFGVAELTTEGVLRLASRGRIDWMALANAVERLGNGQSTASIGEDGGKVSALLLGPALSWDAGCDSARADDTDLASSLAEVLAADQAARPPAGGVSPDPAAWAVIERWFAKCLVPSSEASRLSGAGAGLVDRD